jgi:hypothetical protein
VGRAHAQPRGAARTARRAAASTIPRLPARRRLVRAGAKQR